MVNVVKNILGNIYGKLKVVTYAGMYPIGKGEKSFWSCICECGSFKVIRGEYLKNGTTTSCGCIVKTQKGLSSKEKQTYDVWHNMMKRCYDPKCDMYYNYGGRGIVVCDRWKNSFLNFFEDMGKCPDNMQIDRIDNDGNYEISNCRWVSASQNCLNKRNNRKLNAFGKTQTIQEWAIETGYSSKIIRQRLDREKWTIEKTLTTKPVKVKPPNRWRKKDVALG